MDISLKKKYLNRERGKNTPYTGRTGPHCCCDHSIKKCCASRKRRLK